MKKKSHNILPMLKRERVYSFSLLAILSFSPFVVDGFLNLPCTTSVIKSEVGRRTQTSPWRKPRALKQFTCSMSNSIRNERRPSNRDLLILQAMNKNRMSDGDQPRPVLTKILQKTQRMYTTIVTFLTSRLRMIPSVKPQVWMALILASVLLSGLFRGSRTDSSQPRPTEVPYSAFLSKVKEGDVAEAQISVSSVAYRSKDGMVYFARIPRAPPELVNMLDANQESSPIMYSWHEHYTRYTGQRAP